MTSWFRSWHGAPTDAKWRTIARRAGVRPGDVAAVYWVLLDRASLDKERGSVAGYDIEVIADALGYDIEEVSAIIAVFEEKGVITDGRIVAWEKYQPKREDDSRERVAAYRERIKNEDVTHGNADGDKETGRNAPDTDTEQTQSRTDTESPPTPQGERGSVRSLEWVLQRVKSGKCTKRAPPPYVPEFDEFWMQVVRKEPSKREAYWSWLQVLMRGEEPPGPEDVLAGLGRMVPAWSRLEDKTKIPHITTWLNQDRWTVEHPTMPGTNGATPESKRPAIPPVDWDALTRKA